MNKIAGELHKQYISTLLTNQKFKDEYDPIPFQVFSVVYQKHRFSQDKKNLYKDLILSFSFFFFLLLS